MHPKSPPTGHEPAWHDDPPTERRPFRAVLLPSVHRPVRCVLLGGHVPGIYLHWDGQRSLPCDRPAVCTLCRPGSKRLWYAHAAVLDLKTGREALLRLPRGVVLEHPWLRGRERVTRGIEIELARAGSHAAGAVILTREQPYDRRIPPAFCVRTALLRLWGYVPSETVTLRDPDQAPRPIGDPASMPDIPPPARPE